jgi:capsular polysaccharide export protein
MTLDPAGVNAEGSVPDDPKAFHGTVADPVLIAGVRERLGSRKSRRTGITQLERPLDGEGPFLFVPLQVPNDSQLGLFAGWVKHMSGFIDALAAASQHLPTGWHIRFKEHPSSGTSFEDRIERTRRLGARIQLDNTTDSFCQLRASRGVVTINSSMGLQAFFFDKPVLVLGEAFWALPDLVTVARDPSTLARHLADPESLSFDPALRARFLTWLLTRYYVPVRSGTAGPELCHEGVQAKLLAATNGTAC